MLIEVRHWVHSILSVSNSNRTVSQFAVVCLMDREMLQKRLEEAERHVAQGRRHIAEQEERVAGLARLGADMTEARKLLDNFYASQAQHIQHRDRILADLKDSN
jgi:hypothetical protein